MREISKIKNGGSPLKCMVTSSVEDDSEWLLEDASSIGIGINQPLAAVLALTKLFRP
jgi:hypothetical protein